MRTERKAAKTMTENIEMKLFSSEQSCAEIQTQEEQLRKSTGNLHVSESEEALTSTGTNRMNQSVRPTRSSVENPNIKYTCCRSFSFLLLSQKCPKHPLVLDDEDEEEPELPVQTGTSPTGGKGKMELLPTEKLKPNSLVPGKMEKTDIEMQVRHIRDVNAS